MSHGEEDVDEASSNEGNEETPEEERLKIRKELSTMSFEDLMKLKDKMGSKLYNKTVFDVDQKKTKTKQTTFKRANKNRPREVSSKIKVKLEEKIIPHKKQVSRDPRFDPLCGAFEDQSFKKNYGFLKDVRKNEIKELEKELKSTADANRKQVIKGLLQRLKNQIREQEKREEIEKETYEEKKQIKEKLRHGEKPDFKKKSVKRIENFISKYEELKKQNKLDKHIDKRTKKIKGRDLKNMHINT